MYIYSNPARESDPYAQPDVQVFQLTAEEVATLDEDLIREYMRRHEFRLAGMNSRVREQMFTTMIDEQSIKDGWFYWFCFPGCLPESQPFGPYESADEAARAANFSGE